MDPLVLYDPVKEVEAYLDGQHNGGVFNSGNLGSYSYTYGNPIKYIDPNGKQTNVVFNPVISKGNRNVNKNRFNRSYAVPRIRRDGTKYYHGGIDILANKGSKLRAILGGKVVGVRKSFKPGQYATRSFGNYVIIESNFKGKKVYLKYAHLDKVNVKKGQTVKEGEIFGESGNTGNAGMKANGRPAIPVKDHHVHIEASKSINFNSKTRIDPESTLPTKFDSSGKAIPKSPPPVDSNLKGYSKKEF